MVDVTTTTFGSTATYTCNTGYMLTGDTTRTCGAGGQWSSSAPTCNRKLVWSYVLLLYHYSILILNIRTPLVHNSFNFWINTCMLSMRKIQKFPHINTLYNPPDSPAVDCGAPPTISDGSRTLAGTTFGETTTYTCTTSGFSISGSATITCQANGSWEPEPACTMDRELLSECVRLVQLLCSVQPLIVGHLPLSLMALLEHPHLTQCSMEW